MFVFAAGARTPVCVHVQCGNRVQGFALGRVFTGDTSLVKETEMSHEVVEKRQALVLLVICFLCAFLTTN